MCFPGKLQYMPTMLQNRFRKLEAKRFSYHWVNLIISVHEITLESATKKTIFQLASYFF